MSTLTDQRRMVRVIAAEDAGADARARHETVNILASITDKDKGHTHGGTPPIKEMVQVTLAQYNAFPKADRQGIDTYIDSGGGKAGLRTVFISGYSAPN